MQTLKVGGKHLRAYKVPLKKIKDTAQSLACPYLLLHKDLFVSKNTASRFESLEIFYSDIYLNIFKLEEYLSNGIVDIYDFGIKRLRNPDAKDITSEKMEAIIAKICGEFYLEPLYGKDQSKVIQAIKFLAKGKVDLWNEIKRDLTQVTINLSGLQFYKLRLTPFFTDKVYPATTAFAAMLTGLFTPEDKELNSSIILTLTGFSFWFFISFYLKNTRWFNPWVYADLKNTIINNTQFPNGWQPIKAIS